MDILTTRIEKQAEIKSLLFSEALKFIVKDFSQRAQEIIFSRYGVFNSHPLTLEEIGKKFFQQLEKKLALLFIREVLKKVHEKREEQVFSQVVEKIVLALKANGGIMEKKNLLAVLGKGQSSEQAAATFFLECIDDVKEVEMKGELALSYAMPDFDLEKWQAIKNAVVEILKNQEKPLSEEEIFNFVKDDMKEFDLSKEILTHYLEVSDEIKKNTFGKWGIAKWKEISPKGTREKAYLVLKEAAKPLHFRDIAKKIDQYHLNKKKTHAQTVHNELIKDKNFVLVGRGIYALVEWGYKSGTVKDVIEEILSKSGKQLNRVKKSTIVINLNNYFSKSKSGMYSIKK